MRKKESKRSSFENIPTFAAKFIKLVIKKMRYRRKVRRDVRAELIAHFEDELRDCVNNREKEQKAEQLIAGFGDPKLLAVLMRRAKKRCRPIWKKVLVRGLQVFGIIFLYLLICISPLIIGRPTIKVNYADWLNEFEQADRDAADNARSYYEKADELYVEMPEWLTKGKANWPTDFNDVQLLSLVSWLEGNQKSLEALRAAAQYQYYWRHYKKSGEGKLAETLMPDIMEPLLDYRYLAFAMRWQIRYEAYSGDTNEALRDCVVLVKFGDHLHGHGLLIEQLVGIAVEATALDEISRILRKTDVPAEVLGAIQEELAKQFEKREPIISLEAEKVFWYDQIQRSFTDDGRGGGRVLIRGMPYVVQDNKDILWRLLTFSYPGRRETIEQINGYFEKAAELFEETPRDLHNKGIDADRWSEVFETSFMLRVQGPAFNKVGQLGWRLKTDRAALLTVLATMRYQKEQGKYPDSLDELVEVDYLDDLPTDPFADKPLVYKKTDDNFILYSVGLNFIDDSGKPGRDKNDQVRKWMDNGDTVFWPMPEL